MKRTVVVALFALLTIALFAQGPAYSGQWMVDPSRDPAKLQLTFRYTDPDRSNWDGNNWGNTWGNIGSRCSPA